VLTLFRSRGHWQLERIRIGIGHPLEYATTTADAKGEYVIQ